MNLFHSFLTCLITSVKAAPCYFPGSRKSDNSLIFHPFCFFFCCITVSPPVPLTSPVVSPNHLHYTVTYPISSVNDHTPDCLTPHWLIVELLNASLVLKHGSFICLCLCPLVNKTLFLVCFSPIKNVAVLFCFSTASSGLYLIIKGNSRR